MTILHIVQLIHWCHLLGGHLEAVLNVRLSCAARMCVRHPCFSVHSLLAYLYYLICCSLTGAHGLQLQGGNSFHRIVLVLQPVA